MSHPTTSRTDLKVSSIITGFISLLVVTWPSPGPAQGIVNFNNRVPGVSISHIYNSWPGDVSRNQAGNGSSDLPSGGMDWTGFYLLSGANYRAVLLAAPGADQPDHVLQWAQPVTTFRTGSAAGFVAGVTATLTGVPVDSPVATIRVFAWDDSTGRFPDPGMARQAWLSGIIVAGYSPKINVPKIGGGTNGAPNLIGLSSFNLYHADTRGPHLSAPSQSNVAVQGFRFSVEAESAGAYLVETSPNLSQWSELTWVTNVTGSIDVVDTNTTGLSPRFYRVTQ